MLMMIMMTHFYSDEVARRTLTVLCTKMVKKCVTAVKWLVGGGIVGIDVHKKKKNCCCWCFCGKPGMLVMCYPSF